ncbi:hypothetical protein N7456_005694 [Penicillium angulare]|uniref:AB hydrolase-1 domain-containing protein n=1 Tax=Penicillium angulare TaxID=116970 RepID=A0A9W9KJK5_9EURO|nr:hypothetical protein N7456_005694 [Penicillium angulare]
MGLWKTLCTTLILLASIWWAISEREYLKLVDSAALPVAIDPEFTVSLEDLEKAVYCPISVSNAKETVLLVHGTGMAPELNWDDTLLPPLVAAGFQPCYVAVPHRLLHDVQVNAEYISFAIKSLARDHQISIISWSAGGMTTQWATTFFPEVRSKVKRHIAIGADFHGSWTMAPLVWFNLYTAALVQQVPSSDLITALAKYGGTRAHVPTTAIGSSTDLIVQPGFYGEGWPSLRDSWRLTGPMASNIDLFKLCAIKSIGEGRLPHIVSHDSLLWEAASHKVIFDALSNEETYLGTAKGVTADDCRGGMASGLSPDSEKQHAKIIPELSDFTSKQPVDGWPELPLSDYAIST